MSNKGVPADSFQGVDLVDLNSVNDYDYELFFVFDVLSYNFIVPKFLARTLPLSTRLVRCLLTTLGSRPI